MPDRLTRHQVNARMTGLGKVNGVLGQGEWGTGSR